MSRDQRDDAGATTASSGSDAGPGSASSGRDGAAETASDGSDVGPETASSDAVRDPTVEFARALGVGRNVRRALALGGAFAALLYVVFVVVPAETTQSPVLYLGLAFVVFFATSLLLAIAFTAVSAWRLSREL